MFKNNTNNKIRIYLLSCFIVLAILVGSVFGVSLAYAKGSFTFEQTTSIPYLKSEFYYNSTKINAGGLTGAISSTGEVSVTINGTTTVNAVGSTLTLPLSIKNSGNITGYLKELVIDIVFYDNSVIDNSVDNSTNSAGYYLAFTANSGYTISYNSVFNFENVTLNSSEANSSQFLASINIDEDTDTSDLCNKTFVIRITAILMQNEYESLN